MITKSNWQAVNRQLMENDRRRVGDPPTAEEVLAYTRGELSAEEETRVRERLVCHPDLLRALTEPFPTEGARPGDPDYVSDEEFAAHWPALSKRTPPANKEGRVLQFWRFTAAMAASIAVVLGMSLWQTNRKAGQPLIVAEPQLLLPDGQRGPGPEAAPLSAQGESVLLAIPLIGQREYQRYRIEIVGERERVVWKSSALAAPEDETFMLMVSRGFLDPGKYQVVVFGVTGEVEEPLSTYSLRVPVNHGR